MRIWKPIFWRGEGDELLNSQKKGAENVGQGMADLADAGYP